MKPSEAEEMGDLSTVEPEVFQELFRRRQEDPVFMPKPGSSVWNQIVTLPLDRLEQVVRPNSVEKDKEICDYIMNKIKEDEVAEQI